jgi:hypothetical protein
MFPNAELALMFIPVPISKVFVPGLVLVIYLGISGKSISEVGDSSFACWRCIVGFIIMWY